MRGRKPSSPYLSDLAKPGLTPMPMQAAGEPDQGDQGGDDNAIDGEIMDDSDIADAAAGGEANDSATPGGEGTGGPGGGAGGGGSGGGGGGRKGADEPPAWMDDEIARDQWRRIIPLMRQRRQYIPLFEMEVARYCMAAAEFIKAMKTVAKDGAVAKSQKNVSMLSMHWVVASRAHEIMAKQAADLGFNAVAQMRMQGIQLDLFEAPSPTPAAPTPDGGGNIIEGTPFGRLRKAGQ